MILEVEDPINYQFDDKMQNQGALLIPTKKKGMGVPGLD
jgi:hypothetical protein